MDANELSIKAYFFKHNVIEEVLRMKKQKSVGEKKNAKKKLFLSFFPKFFFSQFRNS